MFLEQSRKGDHKRGWIEVIAGSMFSGKTEELIRRLRRAEYAKQKVEIFKPEVDVRYSSDNIVSHNYTSIRSTPVTSSTNILLLANDVDVVGIDEAQFFDNGIIDVCISLANNGIRIVVAGLDMDFAGRPFGPMPSLLSVAEYVTKVHAVCMKCGDLAQFSHRKTTEDNIIVLGEKDIYEPICRKCYNEANNQL